MIPIYTKGVISAIAAFFLVPILQNIPSITAAEPVHAEGWCLIVWYVLVFLWCYLLLSSVGFGLERSGLGVFVYPILAFCVGGAFTLVTMAFFYGVSIGEHFGKTLGDGLPWDSLIGVPITIIMLVLFPIRDVKKMIEER